MSTFLVTVLVVVVSIAAAVTLALNDPDQPATLRERKRRDPRPRQRPPRHAPPARTGARTGTRTGAAQSPAPAAAGPVRRTGGGAVATAVPATVEVSGLGDSWAPARRISPWLRVRSGFVLTILLAIVGALVAAGVAGVIVLIALAVRSAVG